MDTASATNAVKEEPVEETDDSCNFQFFDIVPPTQDSDGACTTECASGDWSAEVKQENLAVVKQEPDDVCCAAFIIFSLLYFCLEICQVFLIVQVYCNLLSKLVTSFTLLLYKYHLLLIYQGVDNYHCVLQI